ncbi:MAG: PLP-dependent aminotransferase family protein [Alphaproteobacteria bacterium]|nr:PLP-dependent aminotransferase family protein [Alphaproteobacteria bacterium]
MRRPAKRLVSAPLARSTLPLQEQLYRRIRAVIATRQLTPGEKLPSVRTLASELGVARGTVDATYARLAGEGYLLSRGPAGTIVSPELQVDALPARAVRDTLKLAPEEDSGAELRPFQLGLPALDAFPRALWARLTARAAKRLSGGALGYPAYAGLPDLREAIASYLAVSRGVLCHATQVVVTGGYQDALSLMARLLLRPGDGVWFEEPGYFLARHALETASAQVLPIPVDDQGLDVEFAQEKAPRARLAVVTPAHQSVLGVALSLARRQKLLAWASETNAWIVEDDYDGEFHYVGRKLPALKSLDLADRVIYAGSFSKTLFPGLCLGYLVLPHSLIQQVIEAKRATAHGEPVLGQRVVADFLSDGHFGRHLKRMRGLYAARRDALASALRNAFGDRLEMTLRPGGMHLLARFPDAKDDVDLVRRALRHRLLPSALSAQYLGRTNDSGLMLSFTNIPEEQALSRAKALARALGMGAG